MRVLAVNAGSSVVRLSLHDAGAPEAAPRARRRAERDDTDALAALVREAGGGPIDAVAHRVVHGGQALPPACVIDEQVEAAVRAAVPLAPLHNPVALAWVAAARSALGPDVPQIAVLDTGFFRELPAAAATYALPAGLCRKHRLRRVGFHGLAHRALLRAWCSRHPELPGGGKVVSLQLGSGCSAAAVDRGRPVDTSLGFSPLEGLVMATRPGDVDPGVLTFLARAEGLDPDALDELLSTRSGLLGISGTSARMEELLASDAPAARLAVDVWVHRARHYLGAFLAALGGADGVLLGGGIGEHAAPLRERLLADFAWCGLRLDAVANDACRGEAARISAAASGIEAWVLPVDEAAELVHAAREVLGGADAR